MSAATKIAAILALAAPALPAGAQQPTAQGGPAAQAGPAGAAQGAPGAAPAPAQGASENVLLGGVTQGILIGPQPGPDRPLPAIKNPYGADASVLAEGRRLFVWFNCYGCHGGRAGGGMGPSLRDAVWLYGNTDQDIFNSIAEGRQHGMPAWGPKLPAEQLWKITAYIQSLGTPREPDPPPANPVMPHLGPGGTVAKTPPLRGEK